jgi:hypothetical protein
MRKRNAKMHYEKAMRKRNAKMQSEIGCVNEPYVASLKRLN